MVRGGVAGAGAVVELGIGGKVDATKGEAGLNRLLSARLR